MVDVVDTLHIPENLSENEGARPGSAIMRPVEIVAAALVAFIIGVLLLGVVSRYVFSLPFVWVDEVASISFIWLAMLGAAIAVDRNEHLRRTLFVGMMPPRLREFAASALIIGGLGLAFWLLGPTLKTLGYYNILIFLVCVVAACLVAGVPIAFCFGLGTLAFLAFSTNVPMIVMIGRMDEGMSSLILLSVPIFVLLGCILDATGMGKAIVDFLASLLGHVRAGMSYVLLGSLYLVSGISGSKVSDMATVAPALFPEMKRRGYKPKDLIALLSTGAAMADTVPPSIVLIVLGSVAGVSLAGLFTAGFVIAGVLLVIVLYGGISLRKFYQMLVETAALSGAILVILGTALAMAWALTQTGFARDLAVFMANLPGGWLTFMAVTIVVFMILGCVLEGLPAIVLMAPLMFPIAKNLGINDVHYSMVVVTAMNIGLMTPPIGIGFYIACKIGNVQPDEAMGAIWPYLLALVAGLLIIAYVPSFSAMFL